MVIAGKKRNVVGQCGPKAKYKKNASSKKDILLISNTNSSIIKRSKYRDIKLMFAIY